MKAKWLHWIGAAQLAAGVCVAEETGRGGAMPDVANAYVNIPYGELKLLWEAARARGEEERDKPVLPPVGHVLRRIDCVLDVSGGGAGKLEAEFEGEVLAEGWQEVMLMGGDVSLEEAESASGTVAWRDGYRWLGRGPGELRVRARCVVVAGGDLTGDEGIRLRLGAGAVKRLTVVGIPEGHEARVGDVVAGVAGPRGVEFHLPGGEEELRVRVVAARREQVARPSEWRAESRVVVRAEEGRLLHEARVSLRADAGSGLEAALDLPAGVSGVAAEGDDLTAAEVSTAPDGGRRVGLRWKTPDVLDREVTIRYALPWSPLAGTWKMRAPMVAGSGGGGVLYAVVAPEGLVLEGEGVAAVPTRRLGEWMRERLEEEVFVTAEAGPELELRARWLPVVAAAGAVIGESKARLRLVEDGSMQTTASWLIRHEGPLAWRVELPPAVDLLACTVAGKTVKPVRREDGALEFPVPGVAKGGKGGTMVELQYAGKVEALDAVSGRVMLALPRTALFTERVDWDVEFPARYEITAVEGNVSVVAPAVATPEPGLIALRKELCRGEKPEAGFFYQRRDFAR